MQIIKLDATESTNTYLKELSAKKEVQDFTIITTKNQTSGRGQLNSKWESESGKNLAVSMLKNKISIPVDRLYLMNVCVSLSILNSLNQFNIPDLKVKWPNDILSGNFKIGGILIENIISGSKIKRSIIGFGLNVNQSKFKNAPNASSLKTIMGHSFNLDSVFYAIITNLHQELNRPILTFENELYKRYHSQLYKIGVKSNFIINKDEIIEGVIEGVTTNGKLKLKLENGSLQEFGLKEIQLQY